MKGRIRNINKYLFSGNFNFYKVTAHVMWIKIEIMTKIRDKDVIKFDKSLIY